MLLLVSNTIIEHGKIYSFNIIHFSEAVELDLNRNCKNSSQTPNRIICECKDLSQKVKLSLAESSTDYDYVFVSCQDLSLKIEFMG